MKDAPGGGPGWDGSRNDPWVGEKGMLTEGGIRVPFIVTWPGKIAAGQTYSKPVISLDVGATAVALAGLPKEDSLDGVNLIPYLTGKNDKSPHDMLYWKFWGQIAVRQGKWKYLQAGDGLKYLFDLESPEHEKKNLIKEHPEIAAKLEKSLTIWAKELKNPGIPVSINGQEKKFYDHYLPKN
jgi:arylsulfatase A-like enzyme